MLFPLLLATPYKIMINTNPTGRDTTEVAVQRLSQKLITKLNLQNSSRVFEDDSNNISAHDSVPRSLSKLNAALTAFDLSDRQDAEPIDSSKSYSEGEIVYAEGASWRVAAGGADAGDLPSTHPDKFVSFQEGVTSIANKEAAYALTGVAAGTVYKTEDTGQIAEYRGAMSNDDNFTIVGSAVGLIGNAIAGHYTREADFYDGRYKWTNDSGTGVRIYHEYGKWWIEDMMGSFSATSVGQDHPSKVATWTTTSGSGTITSVTKDAPESNPLNWKLDGVISVNTNTEKQALTDLPIGQQVNVALEGGRIERFNGDGDGLNAGDFKILVNHPDNPLISGTRINGIYTYDPSYSGYVNDDGVILGDYGDGTYVFYTGNVNWSAPINGLATPDLMSPWTAQSTAAQGYAAMTSDMITRQPTANESNWFAIKNTVYLSVRDTGYGGVTVNGVTIANNTTVGVGWVPVGEIITTSDTMNGYNLEQVNSGSLVMSGGYSMLRWGTTDLALPDIFPCGATVKINTV